QQRAAQLVQSIAARLPTLQGQAPLSESQARQLAASATSEIRGDTAHPPVQAAEPPRSVFVVHGHHLGLRDLVCATLASLGVETIVLAQSPGNFQSLLQKFLGASRKARFAVVILTADDYGASLLQYDEPGVAERSLQYRARQNVV